MNKDREAQRENQFRDIIALMEGASPLDLPEGFTERCMARLSAERETTRWRSHLYSTVYYLRRMVRFLEGSRERTLPSVAECSFYFCLTGFFYLVMGAVALMGLRVMTGKAAVPSLLEWQPILVISWAVWFFFSGVLLLRHGGKTVKMARYGAMLFALFVVIDGVWVSFFTPIPTAAWLIMGLTAGGAYMGYVLAGAVSRIPNTESR
ncbi:MAG: hypothetical protein N2Z74_00650 [Syntrophales bacterium]|nr:hypothetical protein [Syntrophales bacterium]